MDKVFKKIIEGLEIFDTLYERHQNVTNQSQKEKLENDLKKETKKLQRFREQVKNWQAANEIKDKNQLLEHRRLVEVAMEKYKVVEKGSKTKAYSDQSLAAADEPEIDNEAIEFVRQSLDTLQHQTESLECEIEKLQPTKKGKKNVHNEEQKKELEELLFSHQWHTEKLEIILRLLQNEILSVDDIMNLSDDITYYLDENKSPDFMFDDTIYDDLNLEAEQALINEIYVLPDDSVTNNNTTIPSSSGNTKDSSPVPEQITRSRSIQPISNSTSRSNSIQASRSNSVHNQPTPPKSASNNHISLNNSKPDTHEKPPVIQSIGTSSTHQATVTTLKPAPVPALTSEIKWSSVVTAAKKKDPSPPLQNSINTNALNAASVLEALKKQKPKDSAQNPASNGTATIHLPASNLNVGVEGENGIDTNGQASTMSINPPQNAANKILTQPSSSSGANVEGNKAENLVQSTINLSANSKVSSSLDSALNSNLDSISGSNIETPSFSQAGKLSIPYSRGFTKSQSLAAATDGFRFLPPGIQSFILSISSSKDIANSVYNPFQSINHTPNRTYPTGLRAIHLAESWNKIKTSKDLLLTISTLDHDSLFFGYYYGKSNEERNCALQVLTQKGWKQQKSGSDWYLARSIVSKGDGWNIGDYAVFNVDKWTVSERRNVRIENDDFV